MLLKKIALTAAALAALSAPALAADPNFCGEYAHDAVHQVDVNMSIPGCFHGFNARWNRDARTSVTHPKQRPEWAKPQGAKHP